MASESTAALEEVFTEVLESQVFLFADLSDLEELPELEGEGIHIRMGFSGEGDMAAVRGTIGLALPRSMCVEITANALGIEESEAEELPDVSDAAKELLNVVCGQMLTRLHGEEPVFDLTVPEGENVSGDEWPKLCQIEGGVTFAVDDYPVIAHISVEG